MEKCKYVKNEQCFKLNKYSFHDCYKLNYPYDLYQKLKKKMETVFVVVFRLIHSLIICSVLKMTGYIYIHQTAKNHRRRLNGED